MKIFHEGSYKYVGCSNSMHIFISTRQNFDPEVVSVSRAKLIKKDGSIIIYNPILNKNNSGKTKFLYSGYDSDNRKYSIILYLDKDTTTNSAVCVMKSSHEESNPKRRLTRCENLAITG